MNERLNYTENSLENIISSAEEIGVLVNIPDVTTFQPVSVPADVEHKTGYISYPVIERVIPIFNTVSFHAEESREAFSGTLVRYSLKCESVPEDWSGKIFAFATRSERGRIL